ncbi:MAG TPA: sigma-70 family RNA polymerase sigma factor [Acidobacteriota bacterium]
MDRPTDEELVREAVAGDANAFEALVRRWEKGLYNFILRYLGDPERSRELCQEAFFKAYRNLHRFDHRARFSTWLYTIALNLCHSAFRKKPWPRLASLDESTVEGEAGPQLAETVSDPTIDIEGDLGRDEEAMIVRAAVQSLPAELREVVLLKEYQGLRFREIAEMLGVPVSTVKSKMYAGLDLLARKLHHGRWPVQAKRPQPKE